MPTLTQLEYIVSVDKFRHFGKASEACHVSQPSLSTQLQKAEEELGIVIFDRGKKPILPTDRGLLVIQQAKVILREHERLKYLGQVGQGQLKGEFRLGVIPTLSAYLIPLFLDSWAEKYPKVRLKIDEIKTADIVRDLEEERLDAGLLVSPLHISAIHERILFYEPFFAYVSKSHPLYKRERIRESDLDGSDVWLLGEGHCFRSQMLRLCSLRSKHGVYRNVEFESGSLETLKYLVEHNRGYTLLPYLSVYLTDGVESKKMLKPFVPPVPTREISLVHWRDSLKADIVNALEEEIRGCIPASLKSIQKENLSVVEIKLV
jgi:LysR family transcriptional regulator, hydrogen peroxide-inducible genes activator